MFDNLQCRLRGHSDETTVEYQWDIPTHPSVIPDSHLRGGYVSCEWVRCGRCGRLLESRTIPTEDAPSPVETAPLLG